VADDEELTRNVRTIEGAVDAGQHLERVLVLKRTDQGTDTRTIYLTVSHSSGGQYGAAAPVVRATFADATGAGGTTGDGAEIEAREYDLPA
jgi:hypothetical protein